MSLSPSLFRKGFKSVLFDRGLSLLSGERYWWVFLNLKLRLFYTFSLTLWNWSFLCALECLGHPATFLYHTWQLRRGGCSSLSALKGGLVFQWVLWVGSWAAGAFPLGRWFYSKCRCEWVRLYDYVGVYYLAVFCVSVIIRILVKSYTTENMFVWGMCAQICKWWIYIGNGAENFLFVSDRRIMSRWLLRRYRTLNQWFI